MDLAVWQIILLVILAACTILDALTLVIGLNFPVITGTLAGIIMGDMVLGLAIVTLQLMVLGVGTYGGASIPTLQRSNRRHSICRFIRSRCGICDWTCNSSGTFNGSIRHFSKIYEYIFLAPH